MTLATKQQTPRFESRDWGYAARLVQSRRARDARAALVAAHSVRLRPMRPRAFPDRDAATQVILARRRLQLDERLRAARRRA